LGTAAFAAATTMFFTLKLKVQDMEERFSDALRAVNQTAQRLRRPLPLPTPTRRMAGNNRTHQKRPIPA
jgi:hypothetical protein